jgi:hypothetical protein
MEINVDVLISLENKTLIASIVVPASEWVEGPVESVSNVMLKSKQFDLASFISSRKVEVLWGDIVGRINMDLTSTLSRDILEEGSAWMHVNAVEETWKDREEVSVMMKELHEIFPALNEKSACPVCKEESQLSTIVMHLNDDHAWKREQTANWLESKDFSLETVQGGLL